LVVASVGATVSALQNVSATVLSQGSVAVSAGGTASGLDVGVGSVSVSGKDNVAQAFSAGGNVTQSGTLGGGAVPSAPQASNSNDATAAGQAGNPSAASTQPNDLASNGDDNDLKPKPSLRIKEYVGRVKVLFPK
jgi:hypothetical protein